MSKNTVPYDFAQTYWKDGKFYTKVTLEQLKYLKTVLPTFHAAGSLKSCIERVIYNLEYTSADASQLNYFKETIAHGTIYAVEIIHNNDI